MIALEITTAVYHSAKKQTPRRSRGAAGRFEKIPAATYSPTRKACSTIGSGGLNFRVRDGNGWDPSDVATGNLGSARSVKRKRSLHTRKYGVTVLQFPVDCQPSTVDCSYRARP